MFVSKIDAQKNDFGRGCQQNASVSMVVLCRFSLFYIEWKLQVGGHTMNNQAVSNSWGIKLFEMLPILVKHAY